MSKKLTDELFSVSPDDWSRWSKEYQSNNDRGLVIISTSILDHLLARLLEGFLINDRSAIHDLLDGSYAPLGCFAARISAAYSLGLIIKDERDDLNILRKIRNEFAHKTTEASLSDKIIAVLTKQLKTPKLMPAEIKSYSDLSSKQLFVDTAVMLSTFLNMRTQMGVNNRRISPHVFVIQSPNDY